MSSTLTQTGDCCQRASSHLAALAGLEVDCHRVLRRAVISVAQGLLVASLCGCPGSGGKRVPDGGGRAEGTQTSELERAVIDYLQRAIERARRDRSWRARLPAACPSPLVDWESLQLSETHAFQTLGLGDSLLVAVARPRPKGPPSDRSCSAKIAFRFRDEGAQKLRVRAVWLSDQPEPVMSDPEDTEPESEE